MISDCYGCILLYALKYLPLYVIKKIGEDLKRTPFFNIIKSYIKEWLQLLQVKLFSTILWLSSTSLNIRTMQSSWIHVSIHSNCFARVQKISFFRTPKNNNTTHKPVLSCCSWSHSKENKTNSKQVSIQLLMIFLARSRFN